MAPKNSASMAPLILPSDKPIVKKASSYKINDIIVYKKGKHLTAHRLIYAPSLKDYFITRGDNNLTPDGKIKKEKVLGKIEVIKRNNHKVRLNHIYLTQSSTFLEELKKIVKKFTEKKISFILLKGLPLHIALEAKPPRRLYLDADILIRKKDAKKVSKILNTLGFEGKIGKKIQANFIKQTSPFPTIIDLHLEPAVGFTKTPTLNKIIPFNKAFTNYLFSNTKTVIVDKTKFPILKNDPLFIYLLLHLFHHNLKGAHRLQLLASLSNKVDWNKVSYIAIKFNLLTFAYLALLTLSRFYEIPKKALILLEPKFSKKILAKILVFFINPFSDDIKAIERAKRFFYLFTFSPLSLEGKLKVAFSKEVIGYYLSTIKSFFTKKSVNSNKSFSA
jgi:signal peptidase I